MDPGKLCLLCEKHASGAFVTRGPNTRQYSSVQGWCASWLTHDSSALRLSAQISRLDRLYMACNLSWSLSCCQLQWAVPMMPDCTPSFCLIEVLTCIPTMWATIQPHPGLARQRWWQYTLYTRHRQDMLCTCACVCCCCRMVITLSDQSGHVNWFNGFCNLKLVLWTGPHEGHGGHLQSSVQKWGQQNVC